MIILVAPSNGADEKIGPKDLEATETISVTSGRSKSG